MYILWSTTYPLKGLLPPETFFHTNPLIVIITSISERIILPAFIFIVPMMLLTLILGRFFCGWVCPLGSIIDFTGNMKRKNTYLGEEKNRLLRRVKFYVLGAVFTVALPGVQIAWIFDPMVITARFTSLNLIPAVTLSLDRTFIFFIKKLDYYTPLYDFYRGLKTSFLGIEVYTFAHSTVIFIFFLAIALSTIKAKRLWCRSICPLGAIYAFLARFAFLDRITDGCVDCGKCIKNCRMDAIKKGNSYLKGECVLCMDCVYDCAPSAVRFGGKKPERKRESPGAIKRRDFMFILFSSLMAMGFREKRRQGVGTGVIRPPSALREEDFLDRCIRCGNCMKVCITNGLQPVIFESGLSGVWTPKLIPETGYCEYNCTLCGNVCPTGAIPRLSQEQKKTAKLGTAKVDRSICIAWADDQECLVCEEHCPVHDKAIKIISEKKGSKEILKPYVVDSLCVGCGICQNKCPVRPERAIRVSPRGERRT